MELSQQCLVQFRAFLRFAMLVCFLVVLPAIAQAQTLPPSPTGPEPRAVIFKSILPPKLADDIFGHRLSQQYLAIQVTVVNNSVDRDLIINDVSLDYGALIPDVCLVEPPSEPAAALTQTDVSSVMALVRAVAPSKARELESSMVAMTQRADKPRSADSGNPSSMPLADSNKPDKPSAGRLPCETSSNDLSILRGVAERGQAQDPRNVAYRILQGIGILGGGLTGVAGLGDVLPKAVAAFNGPGLSAFVTIFPDFTLNQMNRLSDTAYSTNTVVAKTRSKIVVAFVPITLFLSNEDIKSFRKDAHLLFMRLPSAKDDKPFGLKDLRVRVAYNYIVNTNDVPPIPTDVQLLSDKEASGFLDKSDIHGFITGQFLDGSQISIANGDGLGLKADVDSSRQSTDNRLYFVLKVTKAVVPGRDIAFQLTKNKNAATISKAFVFPVPNPTLTKIDPQMGTAGSDLKITFTGSNLFDLEPQIIIQQHGKDDPSITVLDLIMNGTSGEATFSLKNATAGKRDIAIRINGQTTGFQTFEVTAKP